MGTSENHAQKAAACLAGENNAAREYVIAFAGNPNVGKSTLFNALTGMKQHTGNWTGKTVSCARGSFRTAAAAYLPVDLPGTYSLMAHSAEEEVARDFICFGEPDAVLVVCDATCLERNLNLVLQTTEISDRVLVCVNLQDEAERKGIEIDSDKLAEALGVPAVSTSARSRESIAALTDRLDAVMLSPPENAARRVTYPPEIEEAIGLLTAALEGKPLKRLNSRWLSLKLLEGDGELEKSICTYLGCDLGADGELSEALRQAWELLSQSGIDNAEKLKDAVVSALVKTAEEICRRAVKSENKDGVGKADRKIDRLLTSKWTGYPIMLCLLALILWLTVSGANYPSQLLSAGLFALEQRLSDLFVFVGAPEWLRSMLVFGVYRVLAWVVSVMLPPMAIFFPLFTLLEDCGFLPRIAYNLDRPFKRCSACGKQALTMCMGFGCNAVGVVGCRIIDSPRERLLAVITNCFVPCNGRFPTLILLITVFLTGSAGFAGASVLSALLLTLVILLGIGMTFAVSRLLSKTLLRGVPSSFTLELPPYRRPQIFKVLVRSLVDRTLFVLGRAVSVAAPTGLVIWLLANLQAGDMTLLAHCTRLLDPVGRLMGMDGVILCAFVLALPANEILLPVIIMTYTAGGSLVEYESLSSLRELLCANGWTSATAVSVILFSLMHWPCSTTLISIKKETGSLKWAAMSFLVPTAAGFIFCVLYNFAVRLFG